MGITPVTGSMFPAALPVWNAFSIIRFACKTFRLLTVIVVRLMGLLRSPATAIPPNQEYCDRRISCMRSSSNIGRCDIIQKSPNSGVVSLKKIDSLKIPRLSREMKYGGCAGHTVPEAPRSDGSEYILPSGGFYFRSHRVPAHC